MKWILLILLSGCIACSTSKYVETSVYVVQSKPDGGMVSEKEWNSFKESNISKVFKEGSSVVSLSGNWYDTAARKLITEPTYMVSYYYKKSATISKQIDSLRAWYKQLF